MTKFTIHFKGSDRTISGETCLPKLDAHQEMIRAINANKILSINDETLIASDAIAFITFEEEESDDSQA